MLAPKTLSEEERRGMNRALNGIRREVNAYELLANLPVADDQDAREAHSHRLTAQSAKILAQYHRFNAAAQAGMV